MLFKSKSGQIVNSQELCIELQSFLETNKSDFQSSLIPDLSHIDHMAQNVNGIDIQEVTYSGGNQYQLDYSYDWEVYRGCSNMDLSDIEHDSVLFTVDSDGYIDIDFFEPEERSTIDEF
ncbi:hypothetical protein BCT47_02935 [Vibrio splendidus]|uniref:hypothetical protein n=1 Tax=Vibrio splendidus TaxID=29497 RepID=UPI000C84EF47|nr:hypothetical protein [Vibrio splendidus]PMM74505.1 hypothetical protein BCT47_02935 [Vibrio splendidus]